MFFCKGQALRATRSLMYSTLLLQDRKATDKIPTNNMCSNKTLFAKQGSPWAAFAYPSSRTCSPTQEHHLKDDLTRTEKGMSLQIGTIQRALGSEDEALDLAAITQVPPRKRVSAAVMVATSVKYQGLKSKHKNIIISEKLFIYITRKKQHVSDHKRCE